MKLDNILLIDDDPDFKAAFQMEAQANNFNLYYKKSFEGLQQIMPQIHHKIVAVVLDIKCLTNDNQAIEDEKFIGVATKYLDINFPRFPRIILTGDDDAFNGYKKYTNEENIFQKTPKGIKEALEKLRYFSENSEILRVKRNNIEVFELFEQGYYNLNSEKTLVAILNNINEPNFQKFGGILRDIRALQETIYKEINSKNKNVVPDNMFKPNGMLVFNNLMQHLSGYPNNKFIPTRQAYHNSAIDNMSKNLYWVSGKYIHADPKEQYHISNYTIKSLIYSLMELFLWSKQYIK